MPPKSSPSTEAEASTSARRVTRSHAHTLTGQSSVKKSNPPPPPHTPSSMRRKPKSFAQKLAEGILEKPDKIHVKDPEYQARIRSIVADENLDESNKITKLTKVMKEYLDKPAKKTLVRSPKTITIDVNALSGLPRLAIEKIIQNAYRHSVKEQAQMAALFNIDKFEFVPMIQKVRSGIDAYPQNFDQEKIPNLLKTYESAITHATADTNVMNDDTTLGKLRNTSILLFSDMITVELGLLLESHETFLYKPLDGRVFLDITIKPTAGAKLQISMCGKLVGKKLVIDDAFNAPGSYSKLPYRSSMAHDESDAEDDEDAEDVSNVLVSTNGSINVERASELMSIACKWIKKYLISTVEVKAKTNVTGAGAKLLDTFIMYISNQRQK